MCVNRVSNPASLHSALMPWDRAKLEDEKRRRLPVETATVKRHFEALQSLKVDVIKQQRLEEATFIVRSKALLKRSSDLGSEVVRNLEVGLHVRVLERPLQPPRRGTARPKIWRRRRGTAIGMEALTRCALSLV